MRRRAGWGASFAPLVGTLLVAFFAFGDAGCRRARATPDGPRVTTLDASYGALRADFVRDLGHPRVLLVVSPTCGNCVRGATVVLDDVVARIGARDLRVYVVWLPVLDEDNEAAARASASRFHDPRVRHYWDRTDAFGLALGRVLAIPASRFEPGRAHGIAWDVYLVYPRSTPWDATIPTPRFWMHQLHQIPPGGAPELEPRALQAQVEAAIRSTR